MRAARRRLKLTQEQLADASGLDQTTISDLETGRHANPRLDTINRLAKALRIAPSELRFISPEPTPSVRSSRVRPGHTDHREVVR